MHATLAFLNAAGRRTARMTPKNRSFMQVMTALLAIVPGSLLSGPRRKRKSKQTGGPDNGTKPEFRARRWSRRP